MDIKKSLMLYHLGDGDMSTTLRRESEECLCTLIICMECSGSGGTLVWSVHKRWLIFDSLHTFSKCSLPLQFIINPTDVNTK